MTKAEYETVKADLLAILHNHPAGLQPTELNSKLVSRGHSRANAKSTLARLWDEGVVNVGPGLIVTIVDRSSACRIPR